MRESGNNKGLALVSVLFFLVPLLALAGMIAYSSRLEAKNVGSRYQSYKLRYAAEGAINLAIGELQVGRAKGAQGLHGSVLDYSMGGVAVEVQVQSDEGKIDINHAEKGVLQAAFEWAGLDIGQAEAIAARAIDWRDSDSVTGPGGAESIEYVLAGHEYSPRNDDFQSVGELLQIMGVSLSYYSCLAPYLTVYGGHVTPNSRYASQSVVEIMKLANEGDVGYSERGLLTHGLSSNNGVFWLKAVAKNDDSELSMQAVVRITDNHWRPFYIHSWRQVEIGSADGCDRDR